MEEICYQIRYGNFHNYGLGGMFLMFMLGYIVMSIIFRRTNAGIATRLVFIMINTFWAAFFGLYYLIPKIDCFIRGL